MHKCIAPRRRSYRLYVYRLSADWTHVCPADTRVSYLQRSAPHRARPDAAGGGRARERLTPQAAEGVRGREGATRPVARQCSLSLYLRGAKGTLILHLHCPKGALTLHLHRPKGKKRQKPPPRAGAEHKNARAPHKTARRNTKPPPARLTATTRRRRRETRETSARDHWGDYTKRQFCKARLVRAGNRGEAPIIQNEVPFCTARLVIAPAPEGRIKRAGQHEHRAGEAAAPNISNL